MNYKIKYLKYKIKYLNEKIRIEGGWNYTDTSQCLQGRNKTALPLHNQLLQKKNPYIKLT